MFKGICYTNSALEQMDRSQHIECTAQMLEVATREDLLMRRDLCI